MPSAKQQLDQARATLEQLAERGEAFVSEAVAALERILASARERATSGVGSATSAATGAATTAAAAVSAATSAAGAASHAATSAAQHARRATASRRPGGRPAPKLAATHEAAAARPAHAPVTHQPAPGRPTRELAPRQPHAKPGTASAKRSRGPASPGAPSEAWTRARLLDLAGELGVPGRTRMSKAELLTAVRAASR
jgi:hypothetical protein